MARLVSLLHPILALAAAPLLLGIINRTKAVFAGRRGQPLLQPYYDLWKLLHKGAVYSRTTTWIFRAGPILTLAALPIVLLLVPCGGLGAAAAFPCDLVLAAYLLGMGRFFTVAAALDTGSAFEGMGASREVIFSALSEPVLFAVLAALVKLTGSLSLAGIYGGVNPALWGTDGPALVLAAVALFVILLTENSRIPIDDPTTHLELTMIHEVMVLDHGGPDLAFILYGASLKMWIFGALLTGIILPVKTGHAWIDAPAFLAGMGCVAAGVGVVESMMARLRLAHVPQVLLGAGAVAVLALLLAMGA